MLGSLARWLRLFGYDCVYPGPIDDLLLAELAEREERWLLTRDAALAASGPRTVHLRCEALDAQLREVFARLRLSPAPTLEEARCAECNGQLHDANASDLPGMVPPHVLASRERFRRCQGCGRVYWPGSHTPRIEARMRRVVETGS